MTAPRAALVTGAGRNIGRSIALRLAADGYGVAVNALRPASAQAVVDEIVGAGGMAVAVAGNVGDAEEAQRVVAGALDRFGRVDVLVNNAAVRPRARFLDITLHDWRDVTAVILDGAFVTTRAVLPGMLERGWGRIINIIGARAQAGDVERAHVVAAKHGLIGLTRALAREFAPHGITVNAVSPGTIQTDRDDDDPTRLAGRMAAAPMGRPGQPEEVAAMVSFLASDEAGYVTGQLVGVNGGELMA